MPLGMSVERAGGRVVVIKDCFFSNAAMTESRRASPELRNASADTIGGVAPNDSAMVRSSSTPYDEGSEKRISNATPRAPPFRRKVIIASYSPRGQGHTMLSSWEKYSRDVWSIMIILIEESARKGSAVAWTRQSHVLFSISSSVPKWRSREQSAVIRMTMSGKPRSFEFIEIGLVVGAIPCNLITT